MGQRCTRDQSRNGGRWARAPGGRWPHDPWLLVRACHLQRHIGHAPRAATLALLAAVLDPVAERGDATPVGEHLVAEPVREPDDHLQRPVPSAPAQGETGYALGLLGPDKLT